jgi:hypothetical protein
MSVYTAPYTTATGAATTTTGATGLETQMRLESQVFVFFCFFFYSTNNNLQIDCVWTQNGNVKYDNTRGSQCAGCAATTGTAAVTDAGPS